MKILSDTFVFYKCGLRNLSCKDGEASQGWEYLRFVVPECRRKILCKLDEPDPDLSSQWSFESKKILFQEVKYCQIHTLFDMSVVISDDAQGNKTYRRGLANCFLGRSCVICIRAATPSHNMCTTFWALDVRTSTSSNEATPSSGFDFWHIHKHFYR